MSMKILTDGARELSVVIILIAVVVILLAQFGATSAVTADANAVINQGINAYGTFADFFDILVIMLIAVAIFMSLRKANDALG